MGSPPPVSHVGYPALHPGWLLDRISVDGLEGFEGFEGFAEDVTGRW